MGRLDFVQLHQRLDAILLERVALGCVAMAASLGVLTAVTAFDGAWAVAAASGLAQLSAFATWGLVRRHRVPEAWAGRVSFVLWSLAELSVLLAFARYRNETQEIWLALLLWAYASMQLRRCWAYATMFLGATAWVAAVLLFGLPHVALHLVSVAAAVGVGLVSFGANRAVVREVEQLRAVDERRREELAAALEAARRELVERQAAEAERERLREQFVAAQRMEAIGTLAGGLAHDMNNVLAGVLGVASLMRGTAQGQDAEDLDMIIESSQRGASLTRALLGFSRQTQYRKERVALTTVVEEALRVLRRTLPRGLEVVDQLDGTVHVEADRAHLAQALLNVCLNSVYAMGERGRLTVSVGRTSLDAGLAAALELSPGEYATLAVEDDGAGMEESVRRRIFEPFFTTKPVGRGSGLGLAMVWGTLRSHGGAAWVESVPGRGTRFTFYLPRHAAPEQVAPPPQPALPVGARGPLRLLVVDDEPFVRKALGAALEHVGHAVTYAVDGVDAVVQVGNGPSAFHAVVLDMSMPRMNGAECHRRLRELAPELPIVCVSGYALDDDTRELLGGDVVFVPKPMTPPQLYAALERALAARKPLSGAA